MSKMGILLIHGFAGKREEMKPLYNYLVEKGYTVELPLLAGHEGTKEDLSRVSYKDWLTSVELSYLELSKKCDEVILIGFSMGGLLAAHLWNYKLAGFITVNTPIYYWNPAMIVKNLFQNFNYYTKKYFEASTDKSLSTMFEFQKLLSNTKPMFENIRCKTMVIQTLDDDTVYHKSADYIYRKVCANKSIMKLPTGGHMVLQSSNWKQVCEAIEQFISTPQAIVKSQRRLAYASHPLGIS